MPKKYLRADTDIARFAKELAGRWQQADGIEPWLRNLEAELSWKVRAERWSWEAIARAMNGAGILYQTGRPWTGTSLLQKITTIRYKARHHPRRKSSGLSWQRPGSTPVTPLPAPFASSPIPVAQASAFEASTSVAAMAAGEDEEPEFRPARLARHWSGTKTLTQASTPPETKASPAQPTTGDADTVIARLLGKR